MEVILDHFLIFICDVETVWEFGKRHPPTLKKGLEVKDMTVRGKFLFTWKKIEDNQKIDILIDGINAGKNS